MAVNLKLGDRLAIIKDGVKKGYTPQEAMLQYQINKDGGYNNWKNQFKLTTGINPDLDDTYNYELFFKENPEAAKLLILGEVSPDILQMYKTPLAIQREKQVLQQRQRGNINSLMDYAQYEKLINDYMNKSVNVSSCGGPVSINMYAEGTDNLNEKRTDITKFGTLESKYKDTRTPNFIDITPEELQNFINDSGRTITIDIPKDNLEGVPEEYKNLPKTRFIRIPYKFLKDRNYNVDDLKEDEAITYYLLDFNENDEYGNPREYYTIRKVNKHTPVGRAYDYWKRDQRLGNVLNSDWLYKDDENIKEGPVDINNTVLLSDVTVTPENNRQFESDTAIPGEYNQQEKYIDPFNIGGTELNVPNNTLYNTQGVEGGSSFGTSTDGLRMPDIFNMNMLDLYTDFQYTPYLWQLEDLEYLNPPGYVPIPNWDVALVYDTGAEGADFADFMKMLAGYGRDNSLRDELMAKLFEPKDYFADPYAGNHYTDTQSFYDAYDNNPYSKIQRESNGIPLYANGGLVNIFDGYGSSYIPRGMKEVGKADDGTYIYTATPDIMKQYYPDLFNLAPSNQGYMFLGKGDDNYTPMKGSEHRYDKFIDYDKLRNITSNTDNNEYYNVNLPEIEVTPQGSTTVYPELSAYSNNTPAANPYNKNDITLQETLQRQWDAGPGREIKLKYDDAAVRNRMFLNNLLEGALLFGGPPLIALGLSNPATALPTIGGLAGYFAGAPIINNMWANYVSPEHNSFDYDFGNAAVSPIRALLGDNNKASITDKNATIIGSFFNPAGLFTAKLGTKTGNSINSVVNSYPLISQLVKNNNFYTPLRTAMAMPKFLDAKFMLEMSRTPQIINDSELYQWSNYSKKQWRDFLKNWNNEAAKGNYYIKNNWLNIDAKPSDIEKIFETGRKTYKAMEEAKKLALQYADKYHSQMNALKDPILRSIAEKSPQYLDEVYEQQLKGGATPEFVRDLIKKANSYRRSMNGENLTSDDFLTFRGHSNVGNREFRSIDVEGEIPSSNYGHVRGYFEGLPELKGDFSTWWDLRIPQGVEVRPGMHDVEAAILDLNKISEGADNIAVRNAFYDTYLPTGAAYRYVVHPIHLVFKGLAETMLPNFKVTLNEAPANFSWSKGYSSGGSLINRFDNGGYYNIDNPETYLPNTPVITVPKNEEEKLANSVLSASFGKDYSKVNDALNFVNEYSQSPGFKQRLNKLGYVLRDYRNSLYSPYLSEDALRGIKQYPFNNSLKYFTIDENSEKVLDNAMYLTDHTKLENCSRLSPHSVVIGKLNNMDISNVGAHEFGHALENSLHIVNQFNPNGEWVDDVDNINYSDIFPIFRQSKAYKELVNRGASEYDKKDIDLNPSKYYWESHDALPKESYADLVLLRYELLKMGIYDSLKKDNLATRKTISDYLRKVNKTNRLFDNFNIDLIIWMLNNIAQNDLKNNPSPNLYNLTAKGGEINKK